jgi:hypothetical protein
MREEDQMPSERARDCFELIVNLGMTKHYRSMEAMDPAT